MSWPRMGKAMNKIDKELSPAYLEKIRQSLLNLYKNELGLKNVEKRIESRINRERGKAVIEKLDGLIPIRNKTVLDIGCGWGEFTFEATQKGANAYGIEPDSELLEISVLLLGKQSRFVKARAEALPFREEKFDIVICNSVIEHVKDISVSLEEMIRVLRKGGYLYLLAPNYLYPYEGHYKTRWIPLLPKPLAKIYLRLIGRNPKFIQHINYNSNYFYLARKLKRNDVVVWNLMMEQPKHFLKRLIIALRIYAFFIPNIEVLIRKI